MAVTDYNVSPSLNVTINGINIANGCPAGNIDNAIRNIMADVRVMYDNLPNGSTFMPLAGGAFTGAVTRASAGSFLYHANAANASGRIIVQPEAAAVPSMSNGDWLATY